MRTELLKLLPADKHDTAKAEALATLGFPAVEPVLPALLEWVQDCNWPVARILLPLLATAGLALKLPVQQILDGSDECWKYSVLASLVLHSPELTLALLPEIERLANNPTPGEKMEAIDELAQDILTRSQHLN